MAVALRLDFDTLQLADYDAVCEALDFPADWPDGLLAHGSLKVDGKLRVQDVWESRDHFDQFVADRLGAAIGGAQATARSSRRSPRSASTPSTRASAASGGLRRRASAASDRSRMSAAGSGT